MKKFRDENNNLTISLEQIKKETAEAGRKYYHVGGLYLYAKDSREYVFIKEHEELARFQSFDGYNLFIPLDSLGTFLPDVASDDMRLTAVFE